MPVPNKDMKTIPGIICYICYTIIFCLTLSCTQTKQLKTKSEIPGYNEKMKPSLSYSVHFSSLTRAFDPVYSIARFTFDEDQIHDKIFEILTTSDLFSLQSVVDYPKVYQEKTALEENTADYHFSIHIGWDRFTFGDEFLDACKAGWVQGSFGLFPWTESAEIIMDIYITSQDFHEKHYSYKKQAVNLFWGPSQLLKKLKTEEKFGYIDPVKFTSKIGEMMTEFLNEFSDKVYLK